MDSYFASHANHAGCTVRLEDGQGQDRLLPAFCPAELALFASPGMANSPEGTTTMVISGMSQFQKYDGETLKRLDIEKLYENSAQRILYRTMTQGSQPHVSYHVEVPGNGKRCTAQMMLSLKYPEEEAKKIALSLGPVR